MPSIAANFNYSVLVYSNFATKYAINAVFSRFVAAAFVMTTAIPRLRRLLLLLLRQVFIVGNGVACSPTLLGGFDR